MLFELLNSLSLTTLFIVLTIAIIVAAELGRIIGARVSDRVADKDASNLATAALGLLALLIAFTYAMASARYDLRRAVVLEEANAIGSTANFALMLPADRQAPALDLLRQYTELRLELGVPADEQKFAADVKRSNAVLAALWQGAVADTAAAPQSLPVYRYVQSLNETNNIAEKRLTALRNHIPVIVLVMLAGTAIIAMAFTGYSAGVSAAHRRIATAIMSLLLAFLIVTTQDLARPDRGAIKISTQPLIDALAAIPSPTHP